MAVGTPEQVWSITDQVMDLFKWAYDQTGSPAPSDLADRVGRPAGNAPHPLTLDTFALARTDLPVKLRALRVMGEARGLDMSALTDIGTRWEALWHGSPKPKAALRSFRVHFPEEIVIAAFTQTINRLRDRAQTEIGTEEPGPSAVNVPNKPDGVADDSNANKVNAVFTAYTHAGQCLLALSTLETVVPVVGNMMDLDPAGLRRWRNVRLKQGEKARATLVLLTEEERNAAVAEARNRVLTDLAGRYADLLGHYRLLAKMNRDVFEWADSLYGDDSAPIEAWGVVAGTALATVLDVSREVLTYGHFQQVSRLADPAVPLPTDLPAAVLAALEAEGSATLERAIKMFPAVKGDLKRLRARLEREQYRLVERLRAEVQPSGSNAASQVGSPAKPPADPVASSDAGFLVIGKVLERARVPAQNREAVRRALERAARKPEWCDKLREKVRNPRRGGPKYRYDFSVAVQILAAEGYI